MTQKDNYEFDLKRDVLSHFITSQNPSDETVQNAKRHSPTYFTDLKEKLLFQYQNQKLLDIKGSKIISTDYGDTLQITQKEKIDFNIAENNFYQQMNKNLKLLPGIGIKTEQNLKRQGFSTIESLKNHYTYGDIANDFLNRIQEMSFGEIINLLDENKYSEKCRDNILKCISLNNPENFKFMDIETLGLSNVPVILIGVAEIKRNHIISTQYFLRNLTEESAVLNAYFTHLDEDSVHVTFNGKTFDVPFIKNRAFANGLNGNIDLPHLDLRFLAKHLWSDELPNCQLQTIEKYKFGIERVDDVPGQYIPGYYKTYLDEDNIGPIVPIIEHNRQDIVSLASFLEKMYEEVN